jgi:hypothetical protein
MNKYEKLINRVMSIHAQSDMIHGGSQITEIQQVEVTGHRDQAVFSEVSRLINAIQGEDIEKSGIHSIHDLLENAAQYA